MSSQTSATPSRNRDKVLLTHANPEDNEITLWLALQLANHGYNIWCDLTKLLGGEVFWDDIEVVIRERAAKVLYILSRLSNGKDGPLRELHLAQSVARKEGLRDFVIPLSIDDLPNGETTIELTRINTVPFRSSWAAGLAKLLEKLEEDQVPRSPNFNRTAVNEWWRTVFSAGQGIRNEPEEYLSNWFPVSIPENVYFHFLSRNGIGKIEIPDGELPYPAVQDGISLITFAPASDFEGKLGPQVYIAQESKPFNVEKLLAETEFGKQLFWLLRLAWEQAVKDIGLPVYELANKAKTVYFPKDHIQGDRISFTGVEGKTKRAMVGFSSRKNPVTGERMRRYWHFGIEARPMVHPFLAYIVKPHVLFTNDGKTLWTSKGKLAAARRSECKDWWNDTWRDRTLAVMKFLCGDADAVTLRLGSNVSLTVQPWPILFQSPVAYTDPQEIKRLADLAETESADDYGRELDADEPLEDDPEESL
ncbi:MAG TPA: toll/interleukin-1 receptor domain-containing protein [Bryobacteraceae bacterium]|jgi:hypothetical protein